MNLKADRNGFLVGEPMGDNDAERILSAIKGDTGRILAAMRQLRGSGGSRGYSSSAGGARASLMRSPSGPVASPVGRGGGAFTGRVRGADGRFVAASSSSGGSAAAQASRRVAEVADAAQAMARTAETQRRDAKADKAANQTRGSDGRFGEGGRGGRFGGFAGALGAGGAALNGSEQIDPLLGAVGEIRGIASAARGVIAPLGRAGAGLFGMGRGGDGGEQPTGWLRKVWRELRGMRKDEAKANRDTLRGIKGIKGGSSGEGGGLLGGLFSLLPAFRSLAPILATVAGGLASFGAMLAGLKRFLPAGLTGAGAAAGGAAKAGAAALVKRLPFVGAMFEAITGVFEDQRIAGDDNLSDAEKRRARAENAGSSGGALAGAAGGAALGSLVGPIGTVVGAVIGGLGGSALGKRAGGAMSARWNAVRGTITGASNAAGVDPGLVAKIAAFESGFDPNAKNPMSSAHGLGQFIDSTWIDTVRKHGEKYGVAGAGGMDSRQILALRGDTNLQASMLAELTRENVGKGRALGGKDDAANAYAFHNLGAGDGARFLKALAADPNASISSVLSGKVISNNPSLYGAGQGTVGEAYAAMSRKMGMGEAFAMSARGVASPGMPGLASVSAPSALMAPGAAPQLDPSAGMRVNSSTAPAPAAPAAPLAGQDVRDRTIAHIVTGGIGAGLTHR